MTRGITAACLRRQRCLCLFSKFSYSWRLFFWSQQLLTYKHLVDETVPETLPQSLFASSLNSIAHTNWQQRNLVLNICQNVNGDQAGHVSPARPTTIPTIVETAALVAKKAQRISSSFDKIE